MPLSAEELHRRAGRVRLILLDVDGVLTSGTVAIDSTGQESKDFFIRDGLALVWARRQGFQVGFLSGRPSTVTTRRAEELGITLVVQGGPDKRKPYEDILRAGPYEDDEVAYMGDDLVDLPVLGRVGISGAPADAVADVRERVHWVSQAAGGRGAVREFIELLFRATGRWSNLVESHLS
jgi:3-deoxy-D-manno-octulosonate 8-phosphate phosphatase (KDO 8-P phosphatase)